MTKMKLYAAKAPMPGFKGHIRDIRTMWILEEFEAPYEVQYIDARNDVNAEWFRAKNPFGKVPVLEDGDFTLFESAAIAVYLADKYKRLIPAPGTKERALHDQWLFAAVANYEFNAVRVFACDIFFPEGPDTEAKRNSALEILSAWLPPLEKRLTESPFLGGKEFQVCDVMLTTILRHLSQREYLAPYPATLAYVKKNVERPAFRRADEKNGG